MGLAAIVRSMKSTACSPSGTRPAGGSAGPSSPLSPWTWDATVSSRDERPVGPGGDGDVVATDEVEHAERVRGRLLQRLVAVHGRHAEQLELGAREREQQRDRVVVPGIAVEDDRDAHGWSIAPARDTWSIGNASAEDRVDLGRGRQRRLRAEARDGERTGRAGAASATPRWSRPSSSETSRHAVKASPAAVPSTTSTCGGVGARHLLAVLEQDRALGTEREGDEAVGARERLELEAVDDGEIGVDRDPPRGRGVEAEQARRLLPGGDDRLVRDLLLAEDRVGRRQLEVRRGGRWHPARRRSSSRRARRP